MDFVEDYWDEQTMMEIEDLLQESDNIFPKNIFELNGINGHLGEVKMDLKLDAQPVNHIPYKLNPRVKKRLRKKLIECQQLV